MKKRIIRGISSLGLGSILLFATMLTAQAAVTQAIPTSYKAEILAGTHSNADTYKIALYTQAAAMLGASTTAYTVTGEVTGTGYVAGGATLSGFSVTTSGTTAVLDWTVDPTWANATITADAFMIYNSSKSNKAVYIGTFTSATSTNDTFTVRLPVPDESNGLIRIQ